VPAAARVRSLRRRLGSYPDAQGRAREIVCRAGFADSLLVIDRDVLDHQDARLIAHLPADEPPENAAVVCREYLDGGCIARCRALTAADLRRPPFPVRLELGAAAATAQAGEVAGLRLCRLTTGMRIPELRWCEAASGVPLSVREAVGRVEHYEPLCGLTRGALERHRHDASVSVVTLAAELQRVLESPIVLNRKLREAVLHRIAREQLSMSQIAIRCGRVKRDRHGKVSGETSWLARRIGLLAEGGQGTPARWIHSDVLGLIAREGLGIAPREVELG
jgi:hypothetical protein